MDEIIKLLTGETPDKAIQLLQDQAKNTVDIKNYREEYKYLKRDIRDTQISNTQKDKILPANGNNPAKRLPAVRIPFSFQKKIVQTATAFEVGERVVITPNESLGLSDEILRLWKVNRIDNKIQKAIEVKKSETEVAICFYIEDVNPDTQFNRVSGPNTTKEIKCSMLSSETGKMAPYFDEFGDMKAFVWSFTRKKGEKDINYTWVFTDTIVYKYSDENDGKTSLISEDVHGFSKIPVVYASQERPEWFDVQEMIDRYETAMSKLGASNDYSGHPILKLYGEVTTMAKREDDGKTLRFNVKETKDGKTTHGDAEFLTNSNAVDSVKLELEKLEDLIYNLSSTPKMSLTELKGLGTVSGVAIKLMFLDAIIKAKLNEGENRTFVERMLNVLISGVVTTTVSRYKIDGQKLIFDIEFQSIIPTDIKETIEYLAQAKEAGLISTETGVKTLGFVEDTEEEIKLIKDGQQTAPGNPKPEPNNK